MKKVNNMTKRIKRKKNPPMKNITINIPELYLDNIEKIINIEDKYKSRSQVIRIATKEFLKTEFVNLEVLNFYGEII